jgi:diguanylate cyclase (GGDEF)-like protein
MNTKVRDVSNLRINNIFRGVVFFWSFVIIALATWNYWQSYTATVEIARSSAGQSYSKDLVYRSWATRHGGVYAPITPETPPNPYLSDISERDISTPSGKKLTLVNPAYMTRQVHELGKKEYGIIGHITSLKPIRPENIPDEWEKSALEAFKRGLKEVSALEPIGNETFLRFIRPLITEVGCLKCHATQGYNVGDIRGGISVSIPWAPFRDALRLQLLVIMLGYTVVWSIGIVGLYYGRKRLHEHLSERKRVEQESAIIAEIGRLIGETPEIEEVYDRFAAEARKLIPFDRLAVNLHSLHEEAIRVAYTSGEEVSGRRKGDLFPMKGSVSEVLTKTRIGLCSHPKSVKEMDHDFPNHVATIQAGMRSLMGAPLIYRDEVIGSLHFRSKKPNAYTEQDLHIAERIGMQIAGAIGTAQLVSALKNTEKLLRESEQRYRELSIVDDLTQLYNSRHFYFQLRIELDRTNRYEQPLTLLLLDLDNFKAFNDAYGHVEGDQVLQRLGQVVKRCLRETDFAYRYGGEEFTVLLPMTTNADGAVIAERIRTEFGKETFSPVPGQEVHVTVSIGLAQYKPQEEMKAFVHRVDQLMYQGKKSGKDRVCTEP